MDSLNERISILTHTHSDCADIWIPYSDKIREYLPYTHNVVTNYAIYDPTINKQILYDDKLPYSLRLKHALENIESKYILLMLEDYIPYAECDIQFIEQTIDKMNSNDSIGFVRLIQSGAGKLCDFDNDLYIISPDEPYFFSTQATIWRRDLLLKLVSTVEIKSVRNEPETSPHLKQLGLLGLCVKARGKVVGGHFDSVCFPYIATACVAGKWNMSEYPILGPLLQSYNIDPNVRGIR